MFDALTSNPMFNAGAGLYGVGALFLLGRRFGSQGWSVARRRLFSSVEVTNRDPSFQWIMLWMETNHTQSFQHMTVQAEEAIRPSETRALNFQLVPSVGWHWIWYKGRLLWFSRKRQEKIGSGDVFESVVISTMGKRRIMEDLIDDAMQLTLERFEHKTVFYQSAGPAWVRFHQPRNKRVMDSVILRGDQRDDLVADVNNFLQREKQYRDLGVPYRRGYLLYGPPGCGKSSFIYALAGEVDMPICLCSLSNRTLGDEQLMSLLNGAPSPAIILMEDIDRAFNPSESRVTFSGVLNALDGVAAQEGNLLFMTTNHRDQLDPALIRPGRVDKQVYVGHAGRDQIRTLFRRFYPNTPLEDAQKFADKLPEDHFSMAQLQGYFFARMDDPAAAFADIDELLEAANSAKQDAEEYMAAKKSGQQMGAFSFMR